MRYKRMNKNDIYQILKRWHSGQKIKRIALVEGRDRKTIRSYLSHLAARGISRGDPLPEKELLFKMIGEVMSKGNREKNATNLLLKHEEEIRALINDDKEPVKPKTAFEIIKHKYNISTSYSTYKSFVRNRSLSDRTQSCRVRIELPPGLEAQLDYGKVGKIYDPITKRNRDVYAFCSVLSFSRLPFIQYVYSQNKESFVNSIIDSFEFYLGCPEFISIDNLKSGVITPDLYDPKINKSLDDMSEYYKVFIDPCRVKRATDKGKIERMIPSARELYRKLRKIYPTADINRLNEYAVSWCRDEYGQREHGTTGVPPITAYNEKEMHILGPLPDHRFEIPIWKSPVVHRDQFFVFLNMRFSVPYKFRNMQVNVRKAGNIVQVFYEYQLIRQYIIQENQKIYYDKNDFPEVIREMLDGSYPRYILKQSMKYGTSAFHLIENILKPAAFLNTRRAQSIMSIMDAYSFKPYFNSVCEKALRRNVRLPDIFRSMLEKADKEHQSENSIEISELGNKMIRDVQYYYK